MGEQAVYSTRVRARSREEVMGVGGITYMESHLQDVAFPDGDKE